MSTIRGGRREKRLAMEKQAWFLCKFLANTLDEDNYEKLRFHISTCKGVKTKVKLSEKGFSTGHKYQLHHKLPFTHFPLDFIENIQQEAMFVNVLLCIFRMQNLPGVQFEIIAYKFPDSATVKKFQDIFQILTGVSETQVLRSPGSTLTLVPGRQYHMGTLSPDRWGSRDRLAAAEYNGGQEIKPDRDNRRTGHRGILDSEGSWSGGSSVNDDRTVFRTADGTATAQAGGNTYTRGGGRSRKGNVTLTSMDAFDGPARRAAAQNDTNSLRKVYARPDYEIDRYPEPVVSRGRYQSFESGSYYNGRDGYPGDRAYTLDRRYQDRDRVDYSYAPSELAPSEAMSMRSQSSYLLSPNFKKVYAPRSTIPARNPGYLDVNYGDQRSGINGGGSTIRKGTTTRF